jgi:glycosyltransferase involved in cell wall biosynthesis
MTASRPLRVLHIITGLQVAGAETMLVKLLSATDRARFEPMVISLTDRGRLGPRIEAIGIPLEVLGMRRGFAGPLAILRLATLIRRFGPDIVQTWMYHADLLGTLAAQLAGRPPVVWNIRQSNLDPIGNKRRTRLVARACALLSGKGPRRILCVSKRARDIHAALGYREDLITVIPNGFDTEHFRPSADDRVSLRRELGLPDTVLLVGLVGRFDPQKDHANFLDAAAISREKVPKARYVLCGKGITEDNPKLAAWIAERRLVDHCYLLGLRNDMARICAALDVAVSSSAFGEGFPNAIGEAMSSGVPCVATDLGDTGMVIGATGRVVAPRDSVALAEAITGLLTLPAAERSALGAAARQRICENFSLPAVADRYQSLYEELCAAARTPTCE